MVITWKTEPRAVADLKDYAKNPRRFTKKGMADLKASIMALGYIDPIAVNLDGTIIGGHARKQTLIDLGLATVDVRVPNRQLTEKEVQQAVIRLNRNTAGEWDFKMLEDSFEKADLYDWGFEKTEFNSFGKPGIADLDVIIEPPAQVKTLQGDIWLLGKHHLACGDSTSAEQVKAMLAGIRPVLMVTDPPYGVNYDATWRDAAPGVFGDGKPKMRGAVENDDRSDWKEAWSLFPGDTCYVWHGALHAAKVSESLALADFEIRSQIIWAKPSLTFGRGHYHWQHEPCWYAVRKGKKSNWQGGRKQTTLWEIAGMNPVGRGVPDVADEKTNHSTQKPVECMKRPIENNSLVGDAVYDPFSGSGTTIIACEMTERRCFAMELNPAYVDMAIMRWQKLTGQKAKNKTTGAFFDDVPPNPVNNEAAA